MPCQHIPPQAPDGSPISWQLAQAPLFPISQQPNDVRDRALQVIFISGSVVIGDQINVGDVIGSDVIAIGTSAQASLAQETVSRDHI
jgi:hypothetical protein